MILQLMAATVAVIGGHLMLGFDLQACVLGAVGFLIWKAVSK